MLELNESWLAAEGRASKINRRSVLGAVRTLLGMLYRSGGKTNDRLIFPREFCLEVVAVASAKLSARADVPLDRLRLSNLCHVRVCLHDMFLVLIWFFFV